ncbi:hypothetical protein [Nocardioides rubriscoriae]|uniref:hypothetical protein n=1 Tax=Nocardioides rubriscoriae TaxID=642762 RepID=UPI0011DF705F|nr:hypothetical protein [Nocardioides rubriscoriae]
MEFDATLDAELALSPLTYDVPWNSWAVPVVRAAEYARFINAWARNDPNGTWGSVIEADDLDGRRYLIHVPTDALPHGIYFDARPVETSEELSFGNVYVADVTQLDYSVDYWQAGEGGLYALDGHTFVLEVG